MGMIGIAHTHRKQSELGLPLYKFKVSRSLTPPRRRSFSSHSSAIQVSVAARATSNQTDKLTLTASTLLERQRRYNIRTSTESVLIAVIVVVVDVVVFAHRLLSLSAHFDWVDGKMRAEEVEPAEEGWFWP